MHFLAEIEFGRPGLLLLSPGLIFVAAICIFFWLRRRRRIIRFLGQNAIATHRPMRIRLFSLLLVVCGAFLGLLPCEPFLVAETEIDRQEPVNLVLAIDLSRSMLADTGWEDLTNQTAKAFRPCLQTRLSIVKNELSSLLVELQKAQSDTKVALVVFARFAYGAIPLFTDDYQLVVRRFDKELRPENLLSMAEGSDPWMAVIRSLQIFERAEKGRNILVLLTDGEPDGPAGAVEKSKAAALEKLDGHLVDDMYLIGIGRPNAPQPVYAHWKSDGCPEPAGGFLLQKKGEKESIIKTVTDPTALATLASELGARYFHSSSGRELSTILQKNISESRGVIGREKIRKRYDLSWPIILFLFAILSGMIMLKTP